MLQVKVEIMVDVVNGFIHPPVIKPDSVLAGLNLAFPIRRFKTAFRFDGDFPESGKMPVEAM